MKVSEVERGELGSWSRGRFRYTTTILRFLGRLHERNVSVTRKKSNGVWDIKPWEGKRMDPSIGWDNSIVLEGTFRGGDFS